MRKNIPIGPKKRTDYSKRRTKYEKRRAMLVERLSHPEHAMMTRTEMGAFLEMDSWAFYKMFPAKEIDAIEREALQMRRERYAPKLARVDEGILKRGAEGDSMAAKLAYQRFEGWSEKQDVTVGADVSLVGLRRKLKEEGPSEGIAEEG